MVTHVSLPPKAAETGKDKATSALARLSVRESSLPLLVWGGGGMGVVGWRSPVGGWQLAASWVDE